jgi:hypothetical protein
MEGFLKDNGRSLSVRERAIVQDWGRLADVRKRRLRVALVHLNNDEDPKPWRTKGKKVQVIKGVAAEVKCLTQKSTHFGKLVGVSFCLVQSNRL